MHTMHGKSLYSQTSIIRRSMGQQICTGLHRISDYQVTSIIRHWLLRGFYVGLHSETMQYLLDKLHAYVVNIII